MLSEKEQDRIRLLWRLGASRNQISRVLKLAHNTVQQEIRELEYEDHIQHNEAVRENQFNDKQKSLISGKPASNYRKQREIQHIIDYRTEEDESRLQKLIHDISPTTH